MGETYSVNLQQLQSWLATDAAKFATAVVDIGDAKSSLGAFEMPVDALKPIAANLIADAVRKVQASAAAVVITAER